jgi:hypothetical protein
MRTTFSIARTLLLVLASVGPAAAQQKASAGPLDSRWLPFLGCWRQLEETMTEENADPTREAQPLAVPTAGVIVCVTPTSNPAAATFSTIVEKQSTFEETVVADGSMQPIGEAGCEGTQRAEWSQNGARLFARADLKCADGTRRVVSGLTTMAPGAMWIDIQAVTSGDRETVRVRRYRRSSDQARVADRLTNEQLALAASAAARRSVAFTMEEVKQMVTKLSPSAVEAALIETGSGFPLNAKRLQELDAAGVPNRVLDLMIALSFPNRFIVERRTMSTSARGGSGYGGGGGGVSLPWLGDDYGIWPYMYSPFGYSQWGINDYYYLYGSPVYVTGGIGVGTPTAPSEHGRVVDGAGYTRVRSRAPEGTAAGGSYSSGGGGGGVVNGGSSSGGGGVSTHGYSGGGGGDSGRTAVPRPPQ